MRDRIIKCAVFIFSCMVIFSCSEESSQNADFIEPINFDTISFEHSMKGWELYSRPGGDDWNFTIIVGTNTLKNYDIVTQHPYTVKGIDNLSEMISRMPKGEEIILMSDTWLNKIWTSPYNDLMLPPTEIVKELDDFCIEEGYTLMVAY